MFRVIKLLGVGTLFLTSDYAIKYLIGASVAAGIVKGRGDPVQSAK
jgi:hypothetical protein